MQFLHYESLPEAAKEIIDTQNFIGYAKVYFRGYRYGSRLFLKAEDGKIREIQVYERNNLKQFTYEMKNAFHNICQTMFEENIPCERKKLYEFCRKNGFIEIENGLLGYYYMENFVLEITVSKETGYFCKVLFYEKLERKG